MKTQTKKPFPKISRTILQLLGPSVVFVALSLNGGEMLLWPSIVTKYGLIWLIIVPVILLFQFAVNIEIERYALVSGEDTLTALTSSYPFLKPVFYISVFISLIWPAWVSIAGNALSVTFFGGANGPLVSLILMISIMFLWFTKNSYLIIESLTKIGLLLLFISIIFIFLNLFKLDLLKQSFDLRNLPKPQDKGLFLAAIAFGGVAGVLNFVQSNWIRNKKYGVSIYSKDELVDYSSKESKTNYANWFRFILKEHFILFYLGNLVGIFLISFIAILTIQNQSVTGFELLKYQIDKLYSISNIFGYIWGFCIFLLFFMAQITILDAAGHLLNNINKNIKSNFFSLLVGGIGLVILSLIVVRPELNQPSGLLETSGVISSIVMIVYPILVLKLNSKVMPDYAKPRLWNKILIYGCVLFYFSFLVFQFLI
ncbi:MAG: Nramp family divalent metal transporter [Patescibacteria group bacterium]